MERRLTDRVLSSKSMLSNKIQSQPLWQALDDMQMFSSEVQDVLRCEAQNITALKKKLTFQKASVDKILENIKASIIHNIDDLKLSVKAELDNIYKEYMEKYAFLKGEVMDCKHIYDEVAEQFANRNPNLPSHYKNVSLMQFMPKKEGKPVKVHNLGMLRSLQDNVHEIKKQHIIGYVFQLQQGKIQSINQICKDLAIVSHYDNEYFKKQQFGHILNGLLIEFKAMLNKIYTQKSQYIRPLSSLFAPQDNRILSELKPTEIRSFKKPAAENWRVNRAQRTIAVEWGQEIRLGMEKELKIATESILLCALEVKKNIIAVGDKSGQVHIYNQSSGQLMNTLKRHAASICTLSLVMSQGTLCLAVGSDHGCSSISLWDTQTWRMKYKITQHKSAVTAIVDMEDGVTMVSGSYDKRVNVYNINEGKVLFTLEESKSGITSILLNSSGSKMICCYLDHKVNIWKVNRSRKQVQGFLLERIIQNNNVVSALACSLMRPELLFIGTNDGKIKLINTDSGEGYKTLSCCSGTIIEMAIVERKSQPQFPIVVCTEYKEETIKVVNTLSGTIQNIPVKGSIEFGCGIGPKLFFSQFKRSLGMLSQSQYQKELRIYEVDIM